MRIEREVTRNQYSGEMGPVLGPPIECTRIRFGELDLGSGNLREVLTRELVVEVIVRGRQGILILKGELDSVVRDDEDGSIFLELKRVKVKKKR